MQNDRLKKEEAMPKKRYRPENIITKLRKAEIFGRKTSPGKLFFAAKRESFRLIEYLQFSDKK
jgi:hypothetical protein